MKKTRQSITRMKSNARPICALTCYDFPTARWQEETGIDLVLVGDSVGVNVLGYDDLRQVTLADMLHHVKAVRRGIQTSYLLADMPYKTYETKDDALENAMQLMDAGADGIKLEGFRPDIVRHLAEHHIDVCAHLGLTPQWHEQLAAQAKSAQDAVKLVRDALELERAGAWVLVLELVPEIVGREVSERLAIPTIGIGAGRYTDGQVLVVPDVLGISSFELRHNRKYAQFHAEALRALSAYVADVRSGTFPAGSNAPAMRDDEAGEFRASLGVYDT